ncbi:MAG: endonuclease/exonuclease/phosphatase family protein [Solirubrobacteraceae bacterium]
MRLRVLTWNLFHGRAVPPAGRALLGEFAAAIAGWGWDVALLQECPRWWPPALAAAAGAEQRSAGTSRNQVAALRRAVAVRAPDLSRSGGGGCNAILVRERGITAFGVRRLRLWPERRVMVAVRLRDGTWVANLHAQAHSAERAHADHARAREALERWTAGGPLVAGGDMNLRRVEWPGFAHAGSSDVDHIFVRGLEALEPGAALEHGRLSDHAPLVAVVA